MSTFLSNPTSFCSPQQALQYTDVRRLGDLVQDGGVRVTQSALLTDPNFQAALNAASGLVESACLVGQRYAPSDLAGLTGVSQVYLQQLVAHLAYGLLEERRYPNQPIPEMCKRAFDVLDALRNGKRIFSIVEAGQAGNLTVLDVDLSQIQFLDLATYQATRLYGHRGNASRAASGL